jgi:hypothetical protein
VTKEQENREDGKRKSRAEPGIHERIRNLSYSDQQKVAREGEQQERTFLERIYGKAVWEALLLNPRITVHEVGRIACKGALPKALLETIVSSRAWLSNAQVRRGVLTNPRLGREKIVQVLRSMPKAELKLVPKQSIYSPTVREAARKLAVGGR